MINFTPLSWIALGVMAVAVAAPLGRRFLATGALLIANIVVFGLMLLEPQVKTDLALYVPNLLEGHPVGILQLLSSMFVHAGPENIFHIILNMIFLWAFGMPFEERIGPRRFVLVYIVAGIVGTLAQALASNAMGQPNTYLLGASGAIFGIMCAFATKYPHQVIGVPVPVILILIRIPMRVLYGALLWVGLDVLMVVSQLRDPLATSNVGHFAHLLGGAAGVVLALTALRRVAAVPGRTGPIAIDLGALGPFAHDAPTKSVLSHMQQNHDEPEVFQAWLDRFFRTATCPTCQHRVMPKHRGEVVCTQGHRFDVRKDRTQKMQAA